MHLLYRPARQSSLVSLGKENYFLRNSKTFYSSNVLQSDLSSNEANCKMDACVRGDSFVPATCIRPVWVVWVRRRNRLTNIHCSCSKLLTINCNCGTGCCRVTLCLLTTCSEKYVTVEWKHQVAIQTIHVKTFPDCEP